MKKLISILQILITSLLILGACKNQNSINEEIHLNVENEQAIFGVWKRIKIDHHYKNELQKKFVQTYPEKYDKNYFITLFPDGKGSISFKTELDSIIWEIMDSTALIIPENKVKYYGNETIKFLRTENDTFLKFFTASGFEEMTFKKHSDLTEDFKQDPLYPDNNLWRIRTERPMTDLEINFKIDNYLKHYEYLFKASIDKKSNRKFTNRNSQGILQIYKSRIGLIKKEKINEDWTSYFYTEKEALEAYDILNTKLKNNTPKIKKTDNWIFDNYKILKQINESLE